MSETQEKFSGLPVDMQVALLFVGAEPASIRAEVLDALRLAQDATQFVDLAVPALRGLRDRCEAVAATLEALRPQQEEPQDKGVKP
jgi:hypothetical protein